MTHLIDVNTMEPQVLVLTGDPLVVSGIGGPFALVTEAGEVQIDWAECERWASLKASEGGVSTAIAQALISVRDGTWSRIPAQEESP
jgi:hypothetical protein